MSEPTAADRRAAYPYFARITTRWMDNDPYAHVNNVVYYSFFDTAVNELLIKSGVSTSDTARSSASWLRRSPILEADGIPRQHRRRGQGRPHRHEQRRYEIGIFRNDDETAAAQGYFVHVYVDRASNRPSLPCPKPCERYCSRCCSAVPKGRQQMP